MFAFSSFTLLSLQSFSWSQIWLSSSSSRAAPYKHIHLNQSCLPTRRHAILQILSLPICSSLDFGIEISYEDPYLQARVPSSLDEIEKDLRDFFRVVHPEMVQMSVGIRNPEIIRNTIHTYIESQSELTFGKLLGAVLGGDVGTAIPHQHQKTEHNENLRVSYEETRSVAMGEKLRNAPGDSRKTQTLGGQ